MKREPNKPWTNKTVLQGISRGTISQKSQIYSAVSKAYKTSTTKISRSYHKEIPR